MTRAAGRVARFASFDAEPDRTVGLADDHAAVTEGRTLFPGTVVGPFESRRFLVSADNSAKIGREILKGNWAGLPVFCLTLEERATCPRSCAIWEGCFGNGMPWARRNDALNPDFIPALKAEVVTLVREVCAPLPNRPKQVTPKGLVIRLHVLGDFFSVAYVRMWGELMRFLPELRIYGYTARRLNDVDPDSNLIAAELARLAEAYPDRWVIRTSHTEAGPGRTIIVDEDPLQDGVIVCPQQTKKTEACSTCALCWSPAAWDKTIAFLRHGIKVRKPAEPKASKAGNHRPGGRGRHVERNSLGLTPIQEDIRLVMKRLADERGVLQVSVLNICKQAGVSAGNWHSQIKVLVASRTVQVLRPGGGHGRPAVYRVFDAPQAEFPPAPLLPMPPKKASTKIVVSDGKPPRVDAKPVVARKASEPLMTRRPAPGDRGLSAPLEKKRRIYKVEARYHPRTGALLNPSAIGSAANYDIGTAEERVAALDEAEKRRIAEQYGAVIKPKAAAE